MYANSEDFQVLATARRKSPAGAGLFLIDMVEWARVMKRCWNAGKWIEIW